MKADIYTYILSFIIGIAASFIASIIYSLSQKQRYIKKNEKKFKNLEGIYQHFKEGKKVEGNTSEIEFGKPNILLVKTNSQRGHNWEGKIFMSESESNTGGGFYEYKYLDRNVWGEISLQISRNEKELLIQSIDKSQPNDIKVGYSMKKIKPISSKS